MDIACMDGEEAIETLGERSALQKIFAMKSLGYLMKEKVLGIASTVRDTDSGRDEHRTNMKKQGWNEF